MNIRIKTPITANYIEAYQQFDRRLFEALAPAFPKMEILPFDGSTKGDVIHIRLNPFGIEWISVITEDAITDAEAYFIDEGQKLPPGLRYWKHRHIIEKIDEQSSVIVDDIDFRGNSRLISFLLYPLLYVSFYSRRKVYKAYF